MRHRLNGLLAVTTLLLFFGSLDANAACGSVPDGAFQANGGALQYCAGSSWVNFSSGGSLGACTGSVTVSGQMAWNGSVIEVCSSGVKYNASAGVNHGACAGQLSPARAGQFYYDATPTTRTYFYCNGAAFFGIPY